jgi:sterol desaturase/sphingolipid hydroxylase (fatty acid hydroxylase superfamily)
MSFHPSWAVISPILIGLWAVGIVTLERAFPYDRGQKLFREGFFTDFFWYTLVQSYVLGLVIDLIIRAIDGSTHVTRLHLVSSWSIPAQLAFLWVTHDFYIYWFHRLQHRSRWLWRLHEAHHSVRDVDWLAGSRSHALEILINQTIEYAPIVLLGAHPDVALMKGVLDATWGMYIHSNIDVRSGALQWVLNGPEAHRWHHSKDVTEGGFNYGTKLAIWDRLFGTAYLPPGQKPPGYGLSGGVAFPRGYFAQLVFAFRPFEPEVSSAPAPSEAT